MVWRIDDLIHLHLTNIRLSDLKMSQHPLSLCDDLLDENERRLLFTFNPLKPEVFDVFNKIVRRNSKYVTTLGQVLDFVKVCTENRSAYPLSVLVGDFSVEGLLDLGLPKNLIVIVKFEG